MNVICFESCVLYSSGVILCCVRGSFPWRFMGADGFRSGLYKFSHWVKPVFRRGEKQLLCLQLISTVRNGGLGGEGIGTSMMNFFGGGYFNIFI